MDYLWFKALHVASALIFVEGLVPQMIAVISCDHAKEAYLRLVQRWDRWATTSALLATWLFGVASAVHGALLFEGWLMGKLAIVIVLSGLHRVQAGRLRPRSFGQFGRVRAMPDFMLYFIIFALVAIAVLAVVKPFTEREI